MKLITKVMEKQLVEYITERDVREWEVGKLRIVMLMELCLQLEEMNGYFQYLKPRLGSTGPK